MGFLSTRHRHPSNGQRIPDTFEITEPFDSLNIKNAELFRKQWKCTQQHSMPRRIFVSFLTYG